MRQDKINTLLMKQDFIVHEQQEPQEKKERDIEIFFTYDFNCFIKDLNQIIFKGKKFKSEHSTLFCPFDEWIYSPWFSFLQEDPDFLFHLRWNIKRIKTYKRSTVSDTGTKFNMKHSLKTVDLQHCRQSPAEHRPLRTTQAASISTTRCILELSPGSATRFPQKALHTRSGSVKHGSLHNFPNLHQTRHKAQMFPKYLTHCNFLWQFFAVIKWK